MVVADAVLVDVVHGEGAGLSVVLAVAAALDGPVAGRLDDGEDDELRLEEKTDVNDFVFLFCPVVKLHQNVEGTTPIPDLLIGKKYIVLNLFFQFQNTFFKKLESVTFMKTMFSTSLLKL